MLSRTQNKVSYNVDEACNYLLESDEEDLGQLEHTKDGGSSTDSEYNNDDNLVSITTNVSISQVDQDAKMPSKWDLLYRRRNQSTKEMLVL